MPLGEAELNLIASTAGKHSQEPVPSNPELRLIFGLCEIIDWKCYEYGDLPEGVTREEIEAYLLAHKHQVMDCPVTSMLGGLSGAFHFLAIDPLEDLQDTEGEA